METKQLLELPLQELELTPEFIAQGARMGFHLLKDILSVSAEELIRTDGFTFRWLNELISFLDKHKLLYLLQPIPGKTAG